MGGGGGRGAAVAVAEQLPCGEPVLQVATGGAASLQPEQIGLVLDLGLSGFEGGDGRAGLSHRWKGGEVEGGD
jgi:hypothetical protein